MDINPFKRLSRLEAQVLKLESQVTTLMSVASSTSNVLAKMPSLAELDKAVKAKTPSDEAARAKQRGYNAAYRARKAAKAKEEARKQRKREYQREWYARNKVAALAAASGATK